MVEGFNDKKRHFGHVGGLNRSLIHCPSMNEREQVHMTTTYPKMASKSVSLSVPGCPPPQNKKRITPIKPWTRFLAHPSLKMGPLIESIIASQSKSPNSQATILPSQ